MSFAVVFGAIIQGSLGFGMNLMVAPLLGLLYPELLPSGAILLALATAALVLARNLRHLQPTALGWAVLGRIPGSVVGAFLVLVASQAQLGILSGLSVLVAVAILSLGRRLTPTRRTLTTAGAISGVMGTATAIGGPPMALVLMEQNPVNLRATMSGFLVFGTLLSTLLLSLVGKLTLNQAQQIATLIPALVLGTALSGVVAPRLDPAWTRKAVLGVSTLSALALLAKSTI
ncbi:MAG: TSUP family transporter [Acidimicrobiales bacterium]